MEGKTAEERMLADPNREMEAPGFFGKMGAGTLWTMVAGKTSHAHGHGAAAASAAQKHGHSHGGVACDGDHGAAASAPPAAQSHGGHGTASVPAQHGHSHGGVACDGNHGAAAAPVHGHGGHGQLHGHFNSPQQAGSWGNSPKKLPAPS